MRWLLGNTKISTPLLQVWELGNRKEEGECKCAMTSVTKLVLIRAVKTIRSMGQGRAKLLVRPVEPVYNSCCMFISLSLLLLTHFLGHIVSNKMEIIVFPFLGHKMKVIVMKNILITYKAIFGQVVNYQKSEILYQKMRRIELQRSVTNFHVYGGLHEPNFESHIEGHKLGVGAYKCWANHPLQP